jgi:hypothetical protein
MDNYNYFYFDSWYNHDDSNLNTLDNIENIHVFIISQRINKNNNNTLENNIASLKAQIFELKDSLQLILYIVKNAYELYHV